AARPLVIHGHRSMSSTSPLAPSIPSLPVDQRLVRIRDLVAGLGPSGRGPRREGAKVVHASGAAGCVAALAARAAAGRDRPVICVTGDAEGARKLADDLAFVTGTAEPQSTLVLLANEASPYADISPDRRAAMARLATLAHLAGGAPFRFLVLPAAALV